GADGRRVERVAGDQRDGGCGEQEEDDDAPELREQDAPGGDRFGRVERVGPVALEAAPRLVAGEAVARRLQAGERVLRRERVPRRFQCTTRGVQSFAQPMGAPFTTFAIAAPRM